MIKKVLYLPMILVIYLYKFFSPNMPQEKKDECNGVLSLYWKGTIYDPKYINPLCPHCGKKFIFRSVDGINEYTHDGETVTYYNVACEECDFCAGKCESEYDAVKEWNRFEGRDTFLDRLIKAHDNITLWLLVFVLGTSVSTNPRGDFFALLSLTVMVTWILIRICVSVIEVVYPDWFKSIRE